MKLTFFISVILACFLNKLQAQTPIGFMFDSSGEPLDGYFDELEYSSNNDLSYSYISNSYEKGHYYDSKGYKKEGLLKYQSKKVWFKTNKNKSKNKLTPNDYPNLVIGLDSFFVARNFYVEKAFGVKVIKEEYVKHVAFFDGYQYAVYYFFAGNGGIFETYILKKPDDKVWISAPEKPKEFKEFALKYFGQIKYLNEKIENDELSHNNMLGLIKMLEYQYKYEAKQRIYFDSWWNEITNEKYAKYSAEIKSKKDSIWTLEYYTENQKLCETQFVSFYPNIKQGYSKWYYQNEKMRKQTQYENNKPKSVKIYYNNGQLHYHYINKFNSYQEVNDQNGSSLLDDEGNGVEILEDQIRSLKITREFVKNKITGSFYSKNDTTIRQLSDRDFDFKLNEFRNSMFLFFQYKELYETIKDNGQGTSLVLAIIDKKGYVLSYKILNTIHPQIDALLLEFLKLKLGKDSSYRYRLKFKPYKLNEEKHLYEVVIPYNFSVKRFYRKPKNYYYHPMQQNPNGMTPPNITPPAFLSY